MEGGGLFNPPEMPIFQQMASALIRYTPEHFKAPYCIVEQAPHQLAGRLKYTIGCDDFPGEAQALPSPELHAACYELFKLWTKGGSPFPRTELRLTQQPDGEWKTNLRQVEAPPPPIPPDPEAFWQAVSDARQKSYELRFGPMPETIQKLLNLTGTWPGGGLYQMAAPRMGGRGICTTFGLTNPDMPAPVRPKSTQMDQSGERTTSVSFTLEARTPRFVPPDLAGYGYELLVATPTPVTWPLLVLSWFVQMEILNDIDLPERVEDAGGVTVEGVKMGDGTQSGDFLVEPAAEPFPPGFSLPNGKMRLFIATWITPDEMHFAMKNGRPALMEKLKASSVGQTSVPGRGSIL